MKPSIVAVMGRGQRTKARFIGSGLLLDDRHVLTAWHVVADASAADMKPVIGMLAGRLDPARATLLARHERYDAAILRLTNWSVTQGFETLVWPQGDRDWVGTSVTLHAVTPTHVVQTDSATYSVTSFDEECGEFELSGGVAGGNSGGVIAAEGTLIGLVVETAESEPLSRAIDLRLLRDWIEQRLGEVRARLVPLPPTALPSHFPELSERGVAGLSHQIDSIHLHVDGARARDVVEGLLQQHRSVGYVAELAMVNEAVRGPQRLKMSQTYQVHTPGPTQEEQLDFFSTTQLHDGSSLASHPQHQKIWMAVHDVLGELDQHREATDVVIELERVVGSVDDAGQVRMSPTLSMGEIGGALETMVGRHLFMPFNLPNAQRPNMANYELHFSLDIPRRGSVSPVALERLAQLMQEANLELGGWFLFQDCERWAYRSNAFVREVSGASLLNRWNKLRDKLNADPNPSLNTARLRLLAEEALAVWKTPLQLANKDTRTLASLAEWEQNVAGLTEFWVSLPNFLGDQNEAVRTAMLNNFDRDVHYVYFLRSDADAKRWLDFRNRMQQWNDKAGALMSAYVVGFAAPRSWDQSSAFIANPRGPAPEAYSLRLDTASNRVIGGTRIAEGKIADIVGMLSPVLTGGAITHWQLVRSPGEPVEVAAACVSLLQSPSEDLFEWLDSKLALLASELNGEVAFYGKRSITVIFEGNRLGLPRACSFACRVLAECLAQAPIGEPLTLRVGVDFGDARQTMRACGLLWTGRAVIGAREVLYGRPERSGIFLSAAAHTRVAGQVNGPGFELLPLVDGSAEAVMAISTAPAAGSP